MSETVPETSSPAASPTASQPASEPASEPAPEPASGRPAARPAGPASTPLLVLRAAHPRQGALTALGLGAAALAAGRPAREAGAVALTALVGQAVLGWDNDVVDRSRDARDQRPGKPVADGRLEAGTLRFVAACAVLLLIPLAVSAGPRAATAYLLTVVAGLAANRVLRRTAWSFLPWAVAFAAYPTVVLCGGWAGAARTATPTPSALALLTLLAAVLGVVVHVLRALPGLVDDHADGVRSLPLLLGLRLGTPRLLTLSGTALAVLLVVLALGLWAAAPDGAGAR